MSRVTIYQFTIYDITTDTCRKSSRWGTREAVERVHGAVLENTGTNVDAAAVATDIPGMTEIGFNPHRHTSPQRQVTQ